MTKAQAEQAMQEGKRVCHRYFEDDEWIKMEDRMIVDELGFRYAAEVYWGQRAQNYWQVDWKIFEEEK